VRNVGGDDDPDPTPAGPDSNELTASI
jgi:hypothetical protein